MDELPLRWSDGFGGAVLGRQWVGGHTNASREARIAVADGLHIEFDLGDAYASAGIVTRLPVLGDFDARVRFSVTNPALGTTFELAAITIDPPNQSAFNQDEANHFTRSRVYDVHGAPPYVSSEFDEADGWRIGWNRASASTELGDGGQPRSDNHFNRYGRSTAPVAARPAEGWLRLVRSANHWASYRLGDDGRWVQTGEVLQMNLSDAVFLRLAAKHWTKSRDGGGRSPAPENRVSFLGFELRSALPAAGSTTVVSNAAAAEPQARSPLAFGRVPPEVALVQELRGCRSCNAFVGENLYGPFVQVETSAPDGHAPRRVRGFAAPDPAALYGCRKAPIMLIGINPNLPGHFVFPRATDGETWRSGSYRLAPFFASDAAYAEHYRFGPKPVLQVPDATALEGLLRQEVSSLLMAEKAGQLVGGDGAGAGSFRQVAQRCARLELKFDDGSAQVHDLTWPRNENLAVVRRKFAAGEVVAGRIDAGVVGRTVDAEPGPKLDGYYARANMLLEQVGKRFAGSSLKLGEDMSLHDAVACASPRWDSAEMPLESIQELCVRGHRWLHRQVEQSAPQVIVIAGRTALELFADPALGTLSTPLAELPVQAGGRDGLFFQVATQGLWWSYRAGPVLRKVRLVVASHLSYGDNFRRHAYFPAAQWSLFEQAHASAVQWLRQEKRVEQAFATEDQMVLIGDDDDDAWAALEVIDPLAAPELRACWIDPFEMLSFAVAAELVQKGIDVDAEGHLKRSQGDCSFCDNAQWRLERGCQYAAAE